MSLSRFFVFTLYAKADTVAVIEQYYMNGFLVQSEISLPADPCCVPEDTGVYRHLYLRRVFRQELDDLETVRRLGGGGVQAFETPTGILLRAEPDIRIFINRQVTEVAIQCAEDNLAAAGSYFVGPALSLCAVLQGDATLHAAGVHLDGFRLGIMGPSGTGKSTTLWSLLDAGALFANDDMIPVQLTEWSATALPSVALYPKRDNSMPHLNCLPRSSSPPSEVLPGKGKYWFPLPPQSRTLIPSPLSALFVLQPRASYCTRPVTVDTCSGASAVPLLLQNLMAPRTASAMTGANPLVQQAALLAQRVRLYRLSYPRRFSALPEMVDVIRKTVNA